MYTVTSNLKVQIQFHFHRLFCLPSLVILIIPFTRCRHKIFRSFNERLTQQNNKHKAWGMMGGVGVRLLDKKHKMGESGQIYKYVKRVTEWGRSLVAIGYGLQVASGM